MNTFIPASLLVLLTCTACDGSLNSLGGPKKGLVSGLVCHDLPLLTAAHDPLVRRALLAEGKCIRIRSYMKQEVRIIRTVMMPGDQKYSQFELADDDRVEKMWIPTSRIGKAV